MYMVCSLLFEVFAIVYIVSGQIFRCPAGLPRTKYLKVFRNKCYFFEHDETSWYNALGECHVHGGTLVHILDQTTQDFIRSTLRNLNWRRNAVWIGARDYRENNEWSWSDSKKRLGPYTNWGNGQPSCSSLGCYETCGQLRLDQDFTWHDKRCSGVFYTYSYICMYDLRPLPTTTTTTAATTSSTTFNIPRTTVTTKIRTTLGTRPTTTTKKTTKFITSSLSSAAQSTASHGNYTSAPTSHVKEKSELLHESDRSKGVKIGVGVGVLMAVLLTLTIFIVVFILRRRHSKRSHNTSLFFSNNGYASQVRIPISYTRNRAQGVNGQTDYILPENDCTPDKLPSNGHCAAIGPEYKNHPTLSENKDCFEYVNVPRSNENIYQDLDEAKMLAEKGTFGVCKLKESEYAEIGGASNQVSSNEYVETGAVSNKIYDLPPDSLA